MPRFPEESSRVTLITGSVFEKYAAKMASHGENLIALHLGDTYLPTRYPLDMDDSIFTEEQAYNRYCNTFGLRSFREVLREKLGSDNALKIDISNILVTAGATNALSISMMALVDPGESVMVLSPAWPFFFGMVKLAGGDVIDVPFYMKLITEPDLDIGKYLEAFITDRTAAIYVNTPNNPSGKVLSREQLEQIAEFARTHNLWVVSDEAYDGLTFDARPHVSIATLPEMFERTLTAFTFSKSFMFAGLRLGYAVANPGVIKSLNKMMVHQLYSPATPAQQMMIKPVQTRTQWLPEIREHYQWLRDIAMNTLAIDIPAPEAGYFAFFPIDDYLKGRDYWQVIEALLATGVSIAPGDSFGASYKTFIRFCFTSEPEERLRLGIERLNGVLFE